MRIRHRSRYVDTRYLVCMCVCVTMLASLEEEKESAMSIDNLGLWYELYNFSTLFQYVSCLREHHRLKCLSWCWIFRIVWCESHRVFIRSSSVLHTFFKYIRARRFECMKNTCRKGKFVHYFLEGSWKRLLSYLARSESLSIRSKSLSTLSESLSTRSETLSTRSESVSILSRNPRKMRDIDQAIHQLVQLLYLSCLAFSHASCARVFRFLLYQYTPPFPSQPLRWR